MSSRAGAAAGNLEVVRFAGPTGPTETWRVESDGSGWVVVGPRGDRTAAHPTIVEALQASAACRFEAGTALHIRTAGLIGPFDLLPVLQEWTDRDSGSDYPDWSEHLEMGWFFEVIISSFDLDPGRLVGIDDGFCGVRQVPGPDGGSKGAWRHLVFFRGIDPPEVMFSDPWASTHTDNGWGIGTYAIGEVVPGVVGEVYRIDEIGPELTTWRLPASYPEGLYDQMMSWISGNVFNTSGFDEARLQVEGEDVTAVFPEGWEFGGEASGWLGPTVLETRATGETSEESPDFR